MDHNTEAVEKRKCHKCHLPGPKAGMVEKLTGTRAVKPEYYHRICYIEVRALEMAAIRAFGYSTAA